MSSQSLRTNTGVGHHRREKMRIWCVCLGVGLLISGCRDDNGITRYTAPKSDKAGTKANVRLLAAILPSADATWFLKFTGPAAVVEQHAQELENFVRSVRFTGKDNPPIEWHVPPAWQKGPDSGSRYATFLTFEDNAAELSITKLGKEAGSLLANVNRWRQQMGLMRLEDFELDAVTKPMTVSGVAATWVDMSAPGR